MYIYVYKFCLCACIYKTLEFIKRGNELYVYVYFYILLTRLFYILIISQSIMYMKANDTDERIKGYMYICSNCIYILTVYNIKCVEYIMII